MELKALLAELRQRVDARLQRDLQLSDACPHRLLESVSYSLLAPGKRVRPCLTLMACEACGGEVDQALPAASAVEMIHAYSLIHDDLPAMDDDDLRRGQPTNHVKFGESTAILAGDGLLTLAFEVLAKGIQPPEVAVACIADLSSAAGVEGMVGGQQADLEAETAEILTLEQLEAIHRRKTGRLLTAALTMGGRVAQTDVETLNQLKIYGESVGLAFQIADDLLDVTGNVEKMGKGVGKDQDHGKATYPGILGIEESQKRATQLIEQACDAVACLAPRSQNLIQLARYIIERDH